MRTKRVEKFESGRKLNGRTGFGDTSIAFQKGEGR